VRDCIVAPITEEWCFRACMVPLLWMEVRGKSTSKVVKCSSTVNLGSKVVPCCLLLAKLLCCRKLQAKLAPCS
jgi:hypothetical protein